MKRILFSIFALLLTSAFSSFAGDLYFSTAKIGGRVLSDTTIYILPSQNTKLNSVTFYAGNNNKTVTYSLLSKIEVLSLTQEPSNYGFCWGACFSELRENFIPESVGDSIQPDSLRVFSFDFAPSGINGTSIFFVKLYDELDSNNKVELTITYKVGANSVFENTNKFSKIFPSISNGTFSIENEMISSETKFVAYSYVGTKISLESNANLGRANFNASNLSNGEYFIDMYNDNKLLGTHKFIISK